MEDKNIEIFDVAIVGAGPAGYTCALHLASSGLKIALVDKYGTNGKKICGDALSGTVINALRRLPGNSFEDFCKITEKLPSYGIRFFAPSHELLDIPFLENINETDIAPGYICSRKIFDRFFYQQILKHQNISFIKFEVETLLINKNSVTLSGPDGKIQAGIVVGADGANSKVAKQLTNRIPDPKSTCLGVRTYYKGISNLHPDNFIELHFLKELLPGYLWIFPMENGIANVGLGMMSEKVRKDKYSLSKKLEDLINNHPTLRERFSKAEKIEKTGAQSLPMGPQKGAISGERFILAGDAAGLVDPFTGEGIGNAMISGEIAANIIKEAFNVNDFSATGLKKYDDLVKRKLYDELGTNKKLQKLIVYSWLFNYVVRRVNKNEKIKSVFIKMLTDPEARKKLRNPLFYLQMLRG